MKVRNIINFKLTERVKLLLKNTKSMLDSIEAGIEGRQKEELLNK